MSLTRLLGIQKVEDVAKETAADHQAFGFFRKRFDAFTYNAVTSPLHPVTLLGRLGTAVATGKRHEPMPKAPKEKRGSPLSDLSVGRLAVDGVGGAAVGVTSGLGSGLYVASGAQDLVRRTADAFTSNKEPKPMGLISKLKKNIAVAKKKYPTAVGRVQASQGLPVTVKPAERRTSSGGRGKTAWEERRDRMEVKAKSLLGRAADTVQKHPVATAAAVTGVAATVIAATAIGRTMKDSPDASAIDGRTDGNIFTRTVSRVRSKVSRKKTKSSKSKRSTSRRRPTKQRKTKGRKEDASGVMRNKYRGQQVYVTKKGQPYVLVASGKRKGMAKFIPR